MRLFRVLNSLTFRFISRYITVLVATVFAVQLLLYTYFSYTYFRDLDAGITEELDTLDIVYRGQSLPGVRQYHADQSARQDGEAFSYRLTTPDGRVLAGDLPLEARSEDLVDGWLNFQWSLWRSGGDGVRYLARSRSLADGSRLLVARNLADAVETGALVIATLTRALIATLILGILGGFLIASFGMRRMEDFSHRLSRIVRENPGERMPVKGEEGYLRELSLVTNSMLDQISLLMQGVKQVSDSIAHDLRTPLTRVRNNLSQLRNRLEPERQEAVDRIIEDCDDLLSTFNALLRISALEAGSRAAADQELDLAALLGDVVELYEPLANDKGVALHWREPGSCVLRGDSDLLFQLFANLVDNAIKYTPGGGEIGVELKPVAGRGVSVTVSDSGPGIPPADRKNVFRRFYRLEASRGQEPGHGLGLSLVQAIAQYHRGTVSLLDNHPGLRVIVNLP